MSAAEALQALGLDHWWRAAQPLIAERLSERGHGDYTKWRAAVDALPGAGRNETRELLLALAPWRKGPFDAGGVIVDAEWRSDLKWARIADRIASLDGRNVLDVGCGNGYYALQMAAAGAHTVIGVDPTILYLLQFEAVNSFVGAGNVHLLPLRIEELPRPAHAFDTTFSMGVLYHRPSPIEHLRELRDTLRPGGQLVLETLFVPGAESYACTPPDRYARMRNVWLLPTIAELRTWLSRTGFTAIDVVDQSITSIDEQRTTAWMRFESLQEALDPTDPSRTVEGWPSPRRVVITAIRP